jgi:hypothetical protein
MVKMTIRPTRFPLPRSLPKIGSAGNDCFGLTMLDPEVSPREGGGVGKEPATRGPFSKQRQKDLMFAGTRNPLIRGKHPPSEIMRSVPEADVRRQQVGRPWKEARSGSYLLPRPAAERRESPPINLRVTKPRAHFTPASCLLGNPCLRSYFDRLLMPKGSG